MRVNDSQVLPRGSFPGNIGINGLKINFTRTAPGIHDGFKAHESGFLWHDTSADTLYFKFNNGVSVAVATASGSQLTTTLDGCYNSGKTITVDDGEITLTDSQTGAGASALFINKTGDVGANAASIFDMAIGNQTGAGIKTGFSFVFGTEAVADTSRGGVITCPADTNKALEITRGRLLMSDGFLNLINADNSATALAAFTNNTKSTGGNIVEISGTAITTKSLLKLTAGALSTGYYIEAGADFLVGVAGATVIAGSAAGTAALTLTAGDAVITEGRIRAACSVNNTFTNAAFYFDPTTVTTGHGIYLDATSVTTGYGMLIEVDESNMTTGKAFGIWKNDANAVAFSIGDLGNVTIAAQADRADLAITLVQGGIGLTAGDITLTAGQIAQTTQTTTGVGNSINASSIVSGIGLKIKVGDGTMTTGKALAIYRDTTEVWSVDKNGLMTLGGVDTEDMAVLAVAATSAFTTANGLFYVNAAASHTAHVWNIASSGVLDNGKAIINIAHAGVMAHANAACLRIYEGAANSVQGSLVDLSTGATATGLTGIKLAGGAVARTSNLFTITDAGTGAGNSFSITASGTGGGAYYALYLNATGAQAEALKVDSGIAVFDEGVTITGTATIGANAICITSPSAGIMAFTTDGVAWSNTNLAQIPARVINNANPSANLAGALGSLAFNTGSSKLEVCTTAGVAGAATYTAVH